MKTKINKTKAMIGMFTALTVTLILSIGAAPAAAAPSLQVADSVMAELHPTPGNLQPMMEIEGLLMNADLIAELADSLAPDEGPFPDGGDWEPVFPDEPEDEAAPDEDAEDAGDDAGDEGVDEGEDEAADDAVPADEGEDEGADEAADDAVPADEGEDEAVDEGEDEACEDGAGDEDVDQVVDAETEEPTEEEPQAEEPEQVNETDELPYTGGDTILWLIAGAGVIVIGAVLIVAFSRRTANR